MSSLITGGCACGAVRYESRGEIEFSFHCHCRKCQRATGAGHASAFALPINDVELTGKIVYHEQIADSGHATYSGFCPACGSPLVSKTDQYPDRIYINAATLDEPSIFRPTFLVFEGMAQPWDPIDVRLRQP